MEKPPQSAAAFRGAPLGNQQALIAFLNNLVLFKVDEENLVIVPPPRTVQLNPFLRFGRPRR